MAAFELRTARYVTAVLADHQNGKVTSFVEASGGKAPIDRKGGAALGDAIHPEILEPEDVAGPQDLSCGKALPGSAERAGGFPSTSL
jgi:hypothetical protein